MRGWASNNSITSCMTESHVALAVVGPTQCTNMPHVQYQYQNCDFWAQNTKILDSNKTKPKRSTKCSPVMRFLSHFIATGFTFTCKFRPESNFMPATNSDTTETHETALIWDCEEWLLCTHTSQIRFCSSSVSFGKSLRAISICKPTMYSLQMSINCCAYNAHATLSNLQR